MELKNSMNIIEKRLREIDKKRHKRIKQNIIDMSPEAAKFALFLINDAMRGYLASPERQRNLYEIVKRSMKARPNP